MSVYSILNLSRPTIGYGILHQSEKPGDARQYAENIHELHAAVRRESETITSAYEKVVREAVTRESQVLRGSLSEYLAMPVRSDNQSVQKIFAESFERYHAQMAGVQPLGAARSFEGTVTFPNPKGAAERKLVAAGKEYLRELGFTPLKTKGAIHESVFVVEGGMNLDVLEHIIRDRLGIYASVHGDHLNMVGGYTFSAYNLIGAWSTANGAAANSLECVFAFSKPEVQYQPFRAGLHEAMAKLAKEIPSITVWQRKLGFGRGKEFIVRCRCGGDISDIISWLQKDPGAKEIRHLFLTQACLLIEEVAAP